MQIIIITVNGETFTLEVNSSDTALDIKHQIEKRTGFLPFLQRLRLCGKLLAEHEKLSDLNVQDGTQFSLLLG